MILQRRRISEPKVEGHVSQHLQKGLRGSSGAPGMSHYPGTESIKKLVFSSFSFDGYLIRRHSPYQAL